MSCICLPGFTGKGDVRCDKISKKTYLVSYLSKKVLLNFHKIKNSLVFLVEPEPIGCSSDRECSSSQACRSRSCINPCQADKPCSQTAICSAENHRATCTCPPGFEGDPYRQCTKSKNPIALISKLQFHNVFTIYLRLSKIVTLNHP